MPKEIIVDQSMLRQVSSGFADPDQEMPAIIQCIEDLREAMPETALGLSAPQIGNFSRVFLARLNGNLRAFVNPQISFPNEYMMPSIEGCLSLPETTRCVSRHTTVNVKATAVLDYVNGEVKPGPLEQEYMGQQACIIAHEQDHLNGVLLIDHPEVKSHEQMVKERQQKKMDKIKNRERKQNKAAKMNPKKAAKLDDTLERSKERRAKSEWIQNQYKAPEQVLKERQQTKTNKIKKINRHREEQRHNKSSRRGR